MPQPAAPTAEARTANPAGWAIVSIVAAAAVAVPLLFDTGDLDAFARPKANLLRGLAIVVLVPVGWVSATRGRRDLRLHPVLDGAVAAFVALYVLATALSPDPRQSLVGEGLQFQGLMAVVIYVVFFYAVRLGAFTATRRLVVLAAITAGGLGAGLYGLAQKAQVDPFWDTLYQGRVFSSLGQPNALAAYMLLALAAAVALCATGPTWARLLGAATAAVILPTYAWTFSRAGYSGLVVFALVLAGPLLWRHRYRWRRQLAVAALAGVVIATLLAFPIARDEASAVWDRATSAVDFESQDFHQKVWLWEVGWAIAVDHPLVGAGPETFPELFPEYSARVLSAEARTVLAPFRPESPHNVFIAHAAGAGLPALGAYLVFLGAWGVLVVRAYRTSPGPGRLGLLALLAGTAGHVVTDAFMTAEVTGSFVFWVLLGVGAQLALDGTADTR